MCLLQYVAWSIPCDITMSLCIQLYDCGSTHNACTKLQSTASVPRFFLVLSLFSGLWDCTWVFLLIPVRWLLVFVESKSDYRLNTQWKFLIRTVFWNPWKLMGFLLQVDISCVKRFMIVSSKGGLHNIYSSLKVYCRLHRSLVYFYFFPEKYEHFFYTCSIGACKVWLKY